MHIGPTTHEHPGSAKVYTYEGDYEVQAGRITWQAEVTHAEEPRRQCTGTVLLTSPAAPAVAEEAVRDAIVRRIDSFSGTSPL